MDKNYQKALDCIQKAKQKNSTELDLSDLQLTQFPPEVLELTNLTELNLTGNQLTTIDVSANTALNWLLLSDNRLTSIDLTANTALIELSLDGNPAIPCSDIDAIHAQFPHLGFTYTCTP